MGINPFRFSSSVYEEMPPIREIVTEYIPLPNPDPSNYVIKNHKSIRGNLLVFIVYPDCTNYEGKKILLFKGTTIEDLMKQELIDPHFSENPKFKSPIARFEPTKFGWEMGLKIMSYI